MVTNLYLMQRHEKGGALTLWKLLMIKNQK